MEAKLSKDELLKLQGSYQKEISNIKLNLRAVEFLYDCITEKINSYENG